MPPQKRVTSVQSAMGGGVLEGAAADVSRSGVGSAPQGGTVSSSEAGGRWEEAIQAKGTAQGHRRAGGPRAGWPREGTQ